MREIKFRGWNKEHRIMIDFLVVTPFVPLLPEIEVMQYTGLKDKNGKEIYEGDIVKQLDYEDKEIDQLAPVVRNSNVNWSWSSFGNIDSALDIEHYPSTEVIGNIYENPELLGVDKVGTTKKEV